MTKLKLHLDADASRKDLIEALRARGHDVVRTPMDGLPEDASGEYQLLWATAQGRAIFTFNIADFIRLGQKYPHHSGIVLASQNRHSLSQLIRLLDRMMDTLPAEEIAGQIRWLADWK